MRGIATVIAVGFLGIVAFGLVAPAMLEPIAEIVLQDSAVQSSAIDQDAFVNGLLRSLLMWAPLLLLASGVVSAVVYYLRRERTGRRVP